MTITLMKLMGFYLRMKIVFFNLHYVVKTVGGAKIP